MNREIKYQAWIPEWGAMVDVEFVDFMGRFIAHENLRHDNPLAMEPESQTNPYCGTSFDDCKLRQYTGLKDKSGTEIYEADRLRVTSVYVVERFGDNYSEPELYEVFRKDTPGGWGAYGGEAIHEFSIQWIGTAAITPFMGVHLRDVTVTGEYFDKTSKTIRTIEDEDSSLPYLTKARHKFKSDASREVIGNIYENPELLEVQND